MKKIKYAFLIFLCAIIFVLGGIETYATAPGFVTEELSAEARESFISSRVRSVGVPPQNAITAFDVSDDHLIAVSYNHLDEQVVCVFSSDGEFLYGYSFSTPGTFYVKWNESGESLLVHFVRGDHVLKIDASGEVVTVYKILETTDDYRTYWRWTRKCVVGDKTYVMRNEAGILNIIAQNYSQIASIDANGEETVIIKAHNVHWVYFLLVSLIIIFAMWYLISSIVKNAKKYSST